MIDTDEKLIEFLPQLERAEWVALDTEADSLYAYPEKLCLMQISIPGADVLVDPLSRMDLQPLWQVLGKPELILHGSDYDLRLMSRWHHFAPTAIFDTMIAARLIGHTQFSLLSLVKHHTGQTLEKGPQKANWAQRPLSPRMEDYARNDTRYLKSLETWLRAELAAKGRLEWHQESCARLIVDCARIDKSKQDEAWRVKGSNSLSRLALAILREIWAWREQEAVSANRPPYFILSHEALLAVAAAAAENLSYDIYLHKSFSTRRRNGLQNAVITGLELAASAHPHPLVHVHHRLTEAGKRRLEALTERRDRVAAELKIDATLIASRSALLCLAQNDEDESRRLMNWQRKLLY